MTRYTANVNSSRANHIATYVKASDKLKAEDRERDEIAARGWHPAVSVRIAPLPYNAVGCAPVSTTK